MNLQLNLNIDHLALADNTECLELVLEHFDIHNMYCVEDL